MAHFYLSPQRDQDFLMPVSMKDWLQEGHLAYFIIDIVAGMDTRALHARHPNDGVGRPAYDPDMMLALLLYAYANGARSTRRIEASCRTDAAYRVICGCLVPDHSTIARFVADQEAAMEAGCAGASPGIPWPRSPGHRPTTPPPLAKAEAVAARRAAAIAAAAERGHALGGRRPGPDNTVLETAAALEAATTAAESAATPRCTANVTDPGSRIMKTKDGWLQGFNAQAVVTAGQIVVATSVSQDANDLGQFIPMLSKLGGTLAAADITDLVELILADAGYWSDANAAAEGPDRLIATLKDYKQRRAAREAGSTTGDPPEGASLLETMEHTLRTAEGAAAYAKRSISVEPVFGDHKENRGWRRFRRRGLKAAESEWAFMNLSHNMAKLFEHRCSQPA